jgi:hypothetical protein
LNSSCGCRNGYYTRCKEEKTWSKIVPEDNAKIPTVAAERHGGGS